MLIQETTRSKAPHSLRLEAAGRLALKGSAALLETWASEAISCGCSVVAGCLAHEAEALFALAGDSRPRLHIRAAAASARDGKDTEQATGVHEMAAELQLAWMEL